MSEKEKQVYDSGRGFDSIKIKKYAKGVKPGGKRTYEESIERYKVSKKGKLAKELLIIKRGEKQKKKIHKIWEKDENNNWVLKHDEEAEI